MKNKAYTVLGLVLSHFAAALQPSAEDQAAFTPDAVLADLMAGNARFVAEEVKQFDIDDRIERGVEGQFPKAYILSCVDSRVPVEIVFDHHIGDIFVGRVAGNVEDPNQLGSMEFASAVAGVRLILVLGHSSCGAVKGACDGVELGNLTTLLAEIRPAVEAVEGFPEDQRNSKNSDFVAAVIDKNVRLTVDEILESSDVISGLVDKGALKVVGAHYSLETGEVALLD